MRSTTAAQWRPLLLALILAGVAAPPARAEAAGTCPVRRDPQPEEMFAPPPKPSFVETSCYAAVDDTSPSYKPWAQRPFCVRATVGTDPNLKVCAFTYRYPPTSPRHGSPQKRPAKAEPGWEPHPPHHPTLSLMTTPANAARIVDLAIFEDQLSGPPEAAFMPFDEARKYWAAGKKWKVVDMDALKDSAAGSKGKGGAEKGSKVKSKGMGVVATRRIQRWETILVDRAVVFGDTVANGNLIQQDGYRLLNTAVRRLADPKVVTDLAKSGIDKNDAVQDVIVTNSFHTEVASADGSGLYPRVSRINHACNPNAYVMFPPSGLLTAVKADRDIEPGEEITISYLTPGLPLAERQSTLRDRWGFTCTCALCTAPESFTRRSDARRERISKMRQELFEGFMKPETTLAELDQQIERAKEILKLIDQEDTAMETGLSHGNHSHDYDDDDDDDYWDEEPSAANKASTTPRGSSQMDSIRAELYEALGRTEVMRSGGQNRDAARVWARKLAKIWKETGFWNDWQWIEREEDSTGDANKDWEELERPNVGEEHVEALVDRWEGEVL